jgi:hypothetical protein
VRGNDLEGVMVKDVFIKDFESVLLEWGLDVEDGGDTVKIRNCSILTHL